MSQRKTDRVILTYEEACELDAIIRNAMACVWSDSRAKAYQSFSRKLVKADIINERLSRKQVNN